MNDTPLANPPTAASPAPGAPASPTAQAQEPFRFPPEFFAALGYPVRVWIVNRLASGAELTATQIAAELKCGFDAVNRHCKVLAQGGVVSSRTGTDRRSAVYLIPEPVRREPGVLDYGWCRFRFK